MSELPDYTVATFLAMNMDCTVARKLFAVKTDGRWRVTDDSLESYSDDQFWMYAPKAVVVALPTALALNRHQAEVLWDMKQEARSCDRT